MTANRTVYDIELYNISREQKKIVLYTLLKYFYMLQGQKGQVDPAEHGTYLNSCAHPFLCSSIGNYENAEI